MQLHEYMTTINLHCQAGNATPATQSEPRSSTPSKEGESKIAEFIPLRDEGVAQSDGIVEVQGSALVKTHALMQKIDCAKVLTSVPFTI